jgi:hypothetical protein
MLDMSTIKVTVYELQRTGRDTQERSSDLLMGTLEAIRAIGAKPVVSSGCLVDESEVDDRGFYRKVN